MADSPELAKARSDVDRAVRAFVAVMAKEDTGEENIYVAAWAGHAEYLYGEGIDSNLTRSTVITPKDQLISTSLGLFDLGKAAFNIRGYGT